MSSKFRTHPHSAAFCVALFSLISLPALADGLNREFNVSPGGTLEIVAEGASINVETGRASRVEIEITRHRDSETRILRDYDIDVRREGDRIVVEVERRRLMDRLFGFFRKGLEIDVLLPQRFDVEIETTGGSIAIANLDGTVDARSSGGSLRFDAIAGKLNARTSGGRIVIEECAGDTNVRTSGGSIRINDARGAVNASTSGGSVKAYISKQPGNDSKLTTSGGSVTVYLDESIAVALDAKTSGGRVRTDFDFEVSGTDSYSKHRILADLNGGGPRLYLRTSGGSIQILKR